MGKMNELSMILDEMITAGNSMVKAAEALKKYYSSASEDKPKTTVAPKVEETATEEPVKEKKPHTYTLVEVRAILTAKTKAGFREEAKAIVNKRGVKNLTDIPESEYAAMVAEAEAIGNE